MLLLLLMSFDVEKYQPSALMQSLADHAIPADQSALDIDVVKGKLGELFGAMRGFEQEKTDILRAHVLTTNDWSIYPEGQQIGIDTCIQAPGGEGFHIWMTSKSGTELYQDSTLNPEEVVEKIRGEATEFRVVFFAADAMEYLHSNAHPDESFLAKVRENYQQNPFIFQTQEIVGDAHRFARDPMYQFYLEGKQSVYMVPLTPPDVADIVEEDVSSALSTAHHNRIRSIVETATHAEEYRWLRHELDRIAGGPPEAITRVRERLLEIQRINGYYGTDVNWETVVIPADAKEDALYKDAPVWDELSVQGLREALTSSAEVVVLQSKLASRAIAADALKAIEQR